MSFDESRAVWMSGQLVPWREADRQACAETIHNGVSETIRCHETDQGPAVFRLDEHIDHFFESAARFGIRIPFTRREISAAVCQIVGANGLRNCRVRAAAYFAGRVETAVVAWPGEARSSSSSAPVTSFLVRDGRLAVSDSDTNSSVTRDAILTIARDLGYPVESASADRHEIELADESFVLNDCAELEPIRVGPITRAIQSSLANATSGRSANYRPWLHFVDECMLAGAYNAATCF